MNKIICKCGAEVDSLSRSHSDRKFNIQRCHDCFDIEHGKEVVAKANAKKMDFERRQAEQLAERKAKAIQLGNVFENNRVSKCKRFSTSIAKKNKARYDIIQAERELELINQEYL